jgi:uncharacterized protein
MILSELLKLIQSLPKLAAEKKKENQSFFKKLKKRVPKHLDQVMVELHDHTFSQIDCLDCANCCKTTGPLFTNKDIERIAKLFRLKPSTFIEQFLRLDEDNDYVLQSVPCTFLGDDNRCSIYDYRPKACQEFPHTNRKKFHQISHLTINNVGICPAAYKIVEAMKSRL